MNSMKNIHQYFIQQLEEYFINDFNYLKLNILRGDLHFKNLKLKPRNIPLDPSPDFPLTLGLVSGEIGSATLQIPWTSPKSGNTILEIDEFHIILRLRVKEPDPSRSYEDILQDQKMAKLDEEEQRFTGRIVSSYSTASWKDSFIKSIKSSILSNFLSSLTIQISNFSMSLLLPISDQNDLTLLRITALHISLSPRESSFDTSSNYLFDKEIVFQSFCLSFIRLPSFNLSEIDESYQSKLSTVNPTPIVNPFNINLDLVVYEEENENSSLHFLTKFVWRSEITLKMSNFEMSPSVSQIALFSDICRYLQDSGHRYRSLLIRPKLNPSSTISNISGWWRYAVVGTMIRRKGSCFLFPRNSFSIGFKSAVSKNIRSKYIHLYIKYLEGSKDNLVSLLDEEVRFLEEWHRVLDFGSLLIFRLTAHKRIEEKLAAVALTTRKENVLWRSLFNSFSSNEPTQIPTASSTDPETDFKILYRDIRQSLQELSYFNMYPFDVKIVFSRFAISLDEDDRRRRTLTLICYGLLWNYHQLSFSCDGMILLRLGSIRVFGSEGGQLLSCGELTDEWFHNYDIQSSAARVMAFSYQHQWYTQNKRSVLYVLPSETVSKPSIAYNNSPKLSHGIKQHQIIEISCNTLKFFWEEKSFEQIRNLNLELEKWIWEHIFPRQPIASSKATILRSSKLERKQHAPEISQPIVKLSVCATVSGLVFQVPLHTHISRPSTRSQHQTDRISSYIELDVGSCSLYSGDFLMSLDIFRNPNTSTSIPSDSFSGTQFDETLDSLEGMGNRFYSTNSGIWSNRDKIMQHKIRKQIGGASLQHFIFTIQNLELKGIFHQEKRSFTEIPINIQMLLTWCFDWSSLAPNLSIDVLSSAGLFSMEMMDLIRISDACALFSFSNISDFFIRFLPVPLSLSSPSRLAALAPLCQFKFHYYLDSFRFSIHSGDQLSPSDLRKDLLLKYRDTILTRGSFSRVTHTTERNLVQQLHFLGANVRCFDDFFNCLQGTSNPESLDDAMKLLEICSSFPSTLYRPLLSLSLFNSQFSLSQLTYDSRFNLYIDELIAFDFDMNPIVHIFPKMLWSDPVPNKSHRKRSNSGTAQIFPHNRRYSSLPLPELHDTILSLRKTSSINLMCLYRDRNFPWGKGGSSSTEARTRNIPISKILEINLEVENIDTVINPSTLSRIMDSFLPLAEILGKMKKPFIQSGVSEYNSDTCWCVHAQAGCTHSVLVTDDRVYLSEIIFTRFGLEIPAVADYTNPLGSCLTLELNSMELFNLSPSGDLHSTILSRIHTLEPMLHLKLELGSELEAVFNIHGMRLCLASRYFYEISALFFHPFFTSFRSKWDQYMTLFKPNLLHPSEPQHPLFTFASTFLIITPTITPKRSILIRADVSTFVCILPRNTSSNDIAAISIEEIRYQRRHVTQSWGALQRTTIENAKECLYFDPESNSWKWSNAYPHDLDDFPSEGESTEGTGTFTETVFIPQNVDESSKIKISQNPFEKSVLSKLFTNFVDGSSEGNEKQEIVTSFINLDEISDEPQSHERPTSRASRSSIKRISVNLCDLDTDSDSDDEYFDTRVLENQSDVHSRPISLKHSSLHKLYQIQDDNLITRHQFFLKNINFYASVSSDDDGDDYVYRIFLPVSSNSPVYSEFIDQKTSKFSSQRWRKVTVMPFSSIFVADKVGNVMRYLLTDHDMPSRIHMNISLVEYYLLLSIYYDNLFEEPQFSNNNASNLDGKSHQTSLYPAYGTSDYLEYIRNLEYLSNLHFVRGDVILDFMMNSNFSVDDIPSLQYLSEDKDNNSQSIAFCSIQLKWISLSSQLGSLSNRAAFGIGEILLTDMRPVDRSHGSHTIRLSQDESNLPIYGYCDYTYGLQSLSSLLSPEVSDLPLQGMAFEISEGWRTIFIGCRSLDLDIRNLELLYLLQDYFSLYFKKPVFGNPVLKALSLIDPLLWPVTGIDLSLFFINPHFQIAEYSVPTSNSVVIEADGGLLVRLIQDRYSSLDFQMRIQNLAIVFLKSYQISTATIGVRGAAGSGLGVRTILADTNLHLSYHHDALHRQRDLQFVLLPKTVNFPQDVTFLTSNSKLYQSGLLDLPKDFVDNFCSMNENSMWNREIWPCCSRIVISYDDFAALHRIFYSCLMIDSQSRISDNFRDQNSFFTLQLHRLQFLIVDDVLGLHLPLIQIYVPKINLQFDLHSPEESSNLSNSFSLICSVEINIWVDTFNNLLKCWEPFLDPLTLILFAEKSPERGDGITIKFGREIHANFSIPVLRTLDNLLKLYLSHRIKKLRSSNSIGDGSRKSNIAPDIHEVTRNNRKLGSQYTSHVPLKRALSNEVSLNPNSKIPFSSKNSMTSKEFQPVVVDHVLTLPLSADARVGFSILNLTGYPIRYLQFWENGNIRTLQYLDSGQRGLLNFIASKTLMRDGDIVEVQFDALGQINKLNKRAVGHFLSLQIAGYKWLRQIQADTLGIKFEDIHPVLGLMDLRKAYPNNVEVQQTVKLVTEVRQENGGRVLQLNSVFIIKNSTTHPLQLLTNETSNINVAQEDFPFVLGVGESFYVPLALLYRSIVKSKADSLGYVWLRPLNTQPVVEELGIPSHLVGNISYTVDPINLKQTVRSTLHATSSHVSGLHHLAGQQLSCKLGGSVDQRQSRISKYGSTRHLLSKRDDRFTEVINNYPEKKEEKSQNNRPRSVQLPTTRIFNYDMLPAFCYNIEIESLSNSNLPATLPSGNLSDTMSDTDASGSKGASDKQPKTGNISPRIYSIVIHPPIVLENLLPVSGTFELIQARDPTKTVLWSAVIESGKSKSVHTVTMDNPLLLLINLDFCRSSEGVLIHTPTSQDQSSSLADTVYKTLEEGLRGLIDEAEPSKSHSHIILTDSVGQRLRLHVQNDMGGGGQRNILIYCPYWVINTSQYTLRLKEEGSRYLPAGTVTAQRDGRIPLLSTKYHQSNTYSLDLATHHDDYLQIEEKVFPGSPGPLHSSKVREIELDSPLQKLLGDLSFDQIRSMSSMFNFLDSSDSKLLGSQKVIAQLDDSNWSTSFTLESVGVNQVLSVDHSEKGMLELSFKITSAPGKLGVFTKIIRFSPRFVVVNKLPVLAQIIQVNGFSQEKVPIQVSPGHLKPFHLPAVFGERQVAVDVAGPWIRSVSFEIDHLGSHTLRIKKYIDPSSLEHIMTRGTPEYDVILPPGEVGVWFETDWDHDQIVVMKIKKGSVAATRTDIQEGDVLLRVNNDPVLNLPFDIVMEKIKKGQQTDGTVLTLQTVEEKMRIIRINAMLGQPNLNGYLPEQIHVSRNLSNAPLSHLSTTHGTHISLSTQSDTHLALVKGINQDDLNQETIIHVQMKSMDSSIFMILSDGEKSVRPEYQIINKSGGYSLHYRQKGMYGARWSILDSGSTVDYFFDDPTKTRSINLRVGGNILCPLSHQLAHLPSINEHPLGCLSMNSAEVLITPVLFDEIGSKSLLSVPYLEKKLELSVVSNGPTKQLIVESPFREYELQYALNFMREQIELISLLLTELEPFKSEDRFTPDCIENLLEKYVNHTKEKQDHCVTNILNPVAGEECPSSKEHFLASIVPFTSMFGPMITRQHQIIVEVLQATGLPPAPLGGTDESYCEVSLRCANVKFGRKDQQRQSTYVNDQTSTPYWIDQIFLFDVPVDPSDPIRGYNISLRMKSRSLVGRDTFLGEADIPLTSLVSEKELYGWFALKPKIYSQHSAAEAALVCGSLQVRIQWIHSVKSLVESVEKQGLKRLEMLRNYSASHSTLLKAHNISEVLPRSENEDSLSFLQSQSNEVVGELSEKSTLFRRKSRRKTFDTGGFNPISNLAVGMDSTSYACLTHQRSISSILRKRRLYPKHAEFMNRRPKVIEFNQQFSQSMEFEFQRNFQIVNATVGRLEIFPELALNLPVTQGPLAVHISYNDEIIKTQSSFSSDILQNQYVGYKSVYQWSTSSPTLTEKKNIFTFARNKHGLVLPGEVPSFQVDTLNIRGNITLSIIEERFPSHVEYASVDIPIFHLLNYLDKMQGDGYSRWFLLDLMDATNRLVSLSHTFSSSLNPDQNLPCICLSLKWNFPTKSSEVVSIPKLYSRLQIPLISLSIIDSSKVREIMHITICEIEGRYSESLQLTNQSLHVNWFQVDNQLYSSSYNSIIKPTCVFHPQPSLRLYICKNDILSVASTPAYDKMEFILQEIDMNLEQQVVASIWEIEQIIRREKMLFYREFSDDLLNKKEKSDIPSHKPFDLVTGEPNPYFNSPMDIEQKLYVEHFYISPIVINVSFLTSPKSSFSQTIATEAVSERSSIDSSSENSPLQIFLWQVGEVVLDLTSNISNSSLKFNGLSIDYMFKTWFDITSTLREHYLNSALGQIYRIVGSLDLVNNPVGLLSSLGTGVRDFFYEPAYALISHPTELKKIGEGVMKGAVSLASNTADGIIGTTTVMTRSVGRGIAYFAQDDTFLANRERLNQFPDSACGVIARPFRDIGNGIFCGIVGVVRLPYHDLKKFGPSGLLTGLGKGIAGLGAKPVIGVLDAVTHTGEGIRAAVKSIRKSKNVAIQRIRFPTLFGIDGRLLPYHSLCALGAYLLYMVEKSEQESLRQKIQQLSDFRKDSKPSIPTRTGSTSASNWPLIRTKRRRSIVDPTSELFSLEGVVFTTILTQLTTQSQIAVVVTTRRIIIVSYEGVHLGSTVSIEWQSSIKDLDTPAFHQTQEVASLTLVNQRLGQGYEIETDISSNHQILQLFMVLSITLYQFDPTVLPTSFPSNLPYSQNNGVLSIGPWQFSQDLFQISSSQEVNDIETLIVNNLESSSWKIDNSCTQSDLQMPRWLQQDKKFVIDSHESIQPLLLMCERSSSENSAIIKSLLDGCMSSEEFRIFVEKDLRFGSAIHETDEFSNNWLQFNSNSSITNQLNSTLPGGDSNFGKAINKFSKRFRNSVSSLPLPFFKQKSDSQISELSSTMISQTQNVETYHPVRESPKVMESFHTGESKQSEGNLVDAGEFHSFVEQDSDEEKSEENMPSSPIMTDHPSFIHKTVDFQEEKNNPLISPPLRTYHPSFVDQEETAHEEQLVSHEIVPKTYPSPPPNVHPHEVKSLPQGPSMIELLNKIQRVEKLMSLLTRSVIAICLVTCSSTPEGAAILTEIAQSNQEIISSKSLKDLMKNNVNI